MGIINAGKSGRRFGIGHLLLAGAALAAAAVVVRSKVRSIERACPPEGKFVEVDGVRLHYIERGCGQPLVLLHGIGCMAKDFEVSGLMDLAATRYRVIAFDRPGYGYSELPKGKEWSPDVQADILRRALLAIGCEHAVVVGHSWGSQVAISLALNHPGYVRAMVLLSGYSFPSLRPDFLLSAVHRIPIVGNVMLNTVSSLLSWLARPVTQRIIFGPSPVPARYADFPYAMMLRPSQLRASIRDNLSMLPSVMAAKSRYRNLAMPVIIVAGEADRLVSTRHHSMRLHRLLPQSELRLVAGVGHMIHHTAAQQVMQAINAASARGERHESRRRAQQVF